MQGPDSIELKTTLRDLGSSFPGRRLTAIHILAELTFTNDEIIRSLSTILAQDEESEVRLAAMQALQNPVHQALIREHPDLLMQGIVATVHAKEEEDKEEGEKIVTAFLARRKRERIYYACFFLAMILYVVILIAIISSGNLQSKDLNCSWVIVFLLAGILMLPVLAELALPELRFMAGRLEGCGECVVGKRTADVPALR